MSAPATTRTDRFSVLAWIVLGFTILVIISGDIVQATESGAGCGETWPRCDGSLIPSISDLQTGVEFTHRILTVVLGFGYIAIVLGAWRRRGWSDGSDALAAVGRLLTPAGFADAYRRSNSLWRVTVWAVVFFVIEVILGAMLVVFGWVEGDASIGRVIVDSVHLVNTFAMVLTLTLIVFHASGGGSLRLDRSRFSHKLLLTGAGIITLIGITGAINSLADALYFAEDVVVEETPIASILVAIRGIHPVVAIGGGIGVFLIARYLATGRGEHVRRYAIAIQGIVWAQFIIGFLNIALLTPLESQVVHLLTAHVLWVLFVLFGARLIENPVVVGEAIEA
ncbi:MAG: COX15/CtaA family protein [Acidimicrobiia bacterium]|nr:COX15/CtaA family protein [Acidimicrobiia bacterium]